MEDKPWIIGHSFTSCILSFGREELQSFWGGSFGSSVGIVLRSTPFGFGMPQIRWAIVYDLYEITTLVTITARIGRGALSLAGMAVQCEGMIPRCCV